MAMAHGALLSLLLLYHAGYKVGKYISWRGSLKIAKKPIMKRSKNLLKNGMKKCITSILVALFLWVLIAAYKEFESRVGVFREDGSKTDRIKEYVEKAVKPFLFPRLSVLSQCQPGHDTISFKRITR